MLLSFFKLSLAIRNVWPRPMSPKAFLALYLLLLLAGTPVTLLSCIPYGLFGILAAACIYGLVISRDTAPQNVCMAMTGVVLTVAVENLLAVASSVLIPSSLSEEPYFALTVTLLRVLLFYLITFFCGKIIKKFCCLAEGSWAFPRRGI